MKKNFSIMLVLTLAALIIIPFAMHPASAHVTKNFGNVIVKIGLANEPPLVGDTNTVQVFVDKGSGNNTTPIQETALDNMTVVITYGGLQKTLQFTPSDDTPDEYDSTVIPTKVGSYNVIVNGTIDGQSVNAVFPLDEVENKDAYYQPLNSVQSSAPPSSVTIPSGSEQSNVSSQVINQLSAEITKAESDANVATQSYANVAKSFDEVKNITDTLFMISITGIGIGAAGIVIAVVAITRKNQV